MKKTALWKTTWREIRQSKARFLSILGIILLGVSLYAGVKATGPNMLKTADSYVKRQHLMDNQLISTSGFSKEDVDFVKKAEFIETAEPGYSLDYNLEKDNRTIRLYSWHEKIKLNRPVLVEGKMPKSSGETAVDYRASYLQDIKIGDTITLSDSDVEGLKQNEFRVVGFVNSPLYIENMSRGTTQVGKGSLDFFMLINEKDFDLPVYTEIAISYQGLNDKVTYSQEYERTFKVSQKKLKKYLAKRPQQTLDEWKTEYEKPLKEAEAELTNSKAELDEARRIIEENERKLEDGRVQLADGRAALSQQLAEARQQLDAKVKELEQKKQEFEKQKQTVEAQSAQLEQGRQQLIAGEQQLHQQVTQLKNVFEQQLAQLESAPELPNPEPKTTEDETTSSEEIEENQPETEPSQPPLPTPESPEYLLLKQVVLFLDRLEQADYVLPLSNDLRQEFQQLKGGIPELASLESGIDEFRNQYEAFSNGMAQLTSAKGAIMAGADQLYQADEQLSQGYQQLEQKKQAAAEELDIKEKEWQEANAQLAEARNKLAEGQQEWEKGQVELTKQKEKLSELKKPAYLYLTRDDYPGFSEFKENADRISSIATVFPVFFFLIAALVSLTTMTRMVDDKRGEIGTMKALGYKNHEIALKFMLYAALAATIGTTLGLLIGFNLFPNVIFDAYGALYNLPKITIVYYSRYIIQSFVVAIAGTLLATYVVLRVDLLSQPAILMRPKAPKAGKRILLERIPFIWRRLSFNQKVTARNLFRYKQRMFMTVFGVAGGMALMVTGFGLRDSITDVVAIQFDKLWDYQSIVVRDSEEKVTDLLKESKHYRDDLAISQEMMTVKKKGLTNQEVYVTVPEEMDKLPNFVLFNQRKSGDVFQLGDEGAFVSEKLAKLWQLSPGDTLKLYDSKNRSHKVKIARVIENYAMHYLYLSPKYYEKVFGKAPTYNVDLVQTDAMTEKEEAQVAEKWMKSDNILNVTFLSETSDAMTDTIDSLTVVVWVLIICAGTLALIVLYNLTNINVEERIRELSTIKVLGFYHREVTMYVYRENNILTVLGIIVGGFLGKALHRFVLETAEVNQLMFSPTIHWQSYAYAGVLTLFFSLIVMLIMHRKLKKVDMIEALKSSE